MALKDLKSILSDFRIPKKTPLVDKPNVEVNKGGNQRPLGGMLESTPKVAIAKNTPNKSGVDTTPIKQGDKFKGETTVIPFVTTDKFKGETTPTKSDSKSQFLGETTPTPMTNLEKFLGETNPTKMDTSEKFLGETTPTESNKESKFLGETSTKPMSLEERYLGETNPTKSDISSKFLGETTPIESNKESKFLGETSTKPMGLEERYLGETTPIESNRDSKFLGETNTKPMNLDGRYLGETTPNSKNNKSNGILKETFLGETTPIESNKESKFLGETTPIESNRESKFLGETNPIESNRSSKFLGETTPTVAAITSKFLGETNTPSFTFNPRHTDNARTPSAVNFIVDKHASGFTLNQIHKSPTRFKGVAGTKFDGTSSLYGELGSTNFFPDTNAVGFTYEQNSKVTNLFHRAPSKFLGVDSAGENWDSTSSTLSNHTLPNNSLSFSTGYKQFKSKTKSGAVQTYTPDSVNYESSYNSIGNTMQQRHSPSFLDEMYDKYNLREDAHNTGLTLFKHPLILRGIQRKGTKGNEPQNWGIAGINFDDGLIRGGVITSTVRAAIDAVRIGKWMASINGVLFGIKQFGLQQSNPNVESLGPIRKTKIWTPINTLASVLGQHIGFHPNRHGITPFDLNDGSYESVQKAKAIFHKGSLSDTALISPGTGNRLVQLHNESFGDNPTKKGMPFTTLLGKGGPNSLYGLIPNGMVPTRVVTTSPDMTNGMGVATPKIGTDSKNTYGDAWLDLTDDDKKEFGVAEPQRLVSSPVGGASDYTDVRGRHKQDVIGDGTIPAAEVIKDYETISYGDIPTRIAGDATINDFRGNLTNDNSQALFNSENYTDKNLRDRVNFGTPGLLGPLENRTEHWKTQAHSGNYGRFDLIQAKTPNSQIENDLVHCYFKTGEEILQFRGAVNGITDTFSPSWDSYKYNGRADNAYAYKSFERSVSFNIQVYATSRIEMKPIYTKLSKLASLTMPVYGGSAGYNGMITKFTLGTLFKDELVFIESLSYSMSDETPWDISKQGDAEYIGELPMGIEVSVGLKVLGKSKPAYGGTEIYSNV